MLQWQPLVLLPLLALVVSATVAVMAWRRRRESIAAVYLTVTQLGLMQWSLMEVVGGSFDSLAIQTGFALAIYPGACVLVGGYLLFALTLADPAQRPSRRLLSVLAIHPVLISIVVATNPWHHRFITSTTLIRDPSLLVSTVGPWFWIHITYTYVLLLWALVALIRAHHNGSQLHRRQITAVLVGSTFPIVANIVNLAQLASGSSANLAPIAFALSGVVFLAAIRQGMLRLVPLARSLVMDQIGDGVLVLGPDGQILDINPAAADISARINTGFARGVGGLDDGEYTFASNPRAVDLDIRGTSLTDSRGYLLGRVQVIRDVTDANAQRRELAALNERLTEQLRINDLLRSELADQAIRDELTGLFNRRHLWSAMQDAMSRIATEGGRLSVVLIDIDHFKRVNDQFGHGVGDQLLKAIATGLTLGARAGDIVARYGGEEFVVLLPGAGAVQAQMRAEELRRRCERVGVPVESGVVSTTISAGVAQFPGSGDSAAELLQAADAAMYLAKGAGRNRVVMAGHSLPD